MIIGEAVEEESQTESGLPEARYLIMKNLVDFNVVSVGNYTWTNDPTAQITESGKYYFYAKDRVGNVGMKAISVEGPDMTAPVIDSVTQTPKEGAVILKTLAHDNVGITEYCVVKGTSSSIPTNWTVIEPTQQLVFEHTVAEDGYYTVWVKDEAGYTDRKVVNVITNKFPELDEYPKDVHILEEEQHHLMLLLKKMDIQLFMIMYGKLVKMAV